MNRSSAELKKLSRSTLNGQWGLPIGASFLLTIVLAFTLGFLNFNNLRDASGLTALLLAEAVNLVVTLIYGVFQAGLQYMFLNMCRGKEFSFHDLIYAFSHHPDRFILSRFIIVLISLVCSTPAYICNYFMSNDEYLGGWLFIYGLLLVVGNIVSLLITLRFSLSTQLLIDHTDMGAMESLKESNRLMNGHKWRYFYISLSFIGWFILSIFTCYISLLWLMPYMTTTFSYFYLDVIGELNQ